MKFNLFIDYPWYFVPLCFLLGAVAAYFTYRKNIFATEEKPFAWPVWLMALLRFFTVSILAFLLLGPVVKSIDKKLEKPVVILAADNSQSILINKDSAYYKGQYKQDLQEVADKLREKYDVRTYTFGGKVNENLSLNYSDKQTDISQLYDHIYDAFYNQNIGAVITLTDGIYNQGQNPLYLAERFNAPFYTVALGDTTPQNDVLIKDVQYNKIAYSGNILPLQIQLKAKGFSGKDVNLTISHAGATMFSQAVHLSGNNFYQEIPAKVQAVGTGMQRYHIEVTKLSGEISHVNNSFDVFIDILDSKRKILIVAASPNPDIAALKNSIERNSSFEVESYLYDEFMKTIGGSAKKLENYQLAILHGLPGSSKPASQLISGLNEAGVSVLFILGSSTSIPVFNNLDEGLLIQGSGNRTNEVTASLNETFSLFTLSPGLNDELQKWPPMYAPYGEYRVADMQNVLLWQQVGKVRTQMPLLMFTARGRQKIGIMAGEGIWRWFLTEYAQKENFKTIDEIIEKTVQYLSVKSDNRLFRLRPSKNLFYEDEHVTFEAEVYNQSYEPVKDASIELRVKNEQGKEFHFTFQPKGNAYFLDAGMLNAGTYTYQGLTRIGGKAYTLSGEFIVKKMELEYLETVANHRLLYSIAKQQGGKMLYPNQIKQLPELLAARDDIQPVSYLQSEMRDLIHFKWLFALLLLFLGGEWFMRKYFGGY